MTPSPGELPPLAQSTFWWPDSPARTSASPEDEREWLERVALWQSDLLTLFANYGPPGCCSRTSLACCPALRTRRRIRVCRTISASWENGRAAIVTTPTKEAISATLWPRFQNSGVATSPGQFWTLSTSAWRSGANVCSLSDVIEDGPAHQAFVPQRYCLTARACRGILRRAAARGKELPTALASALTSAAGAPATSQPVESPK